jgi:S1-C subfamily serine protease
MLRRIRRPVAISISALLAAALIGGGVGAAVYAAFGGGDASSSPSAVSSGRPAAQTQTTALSVNQIYRLASPGVVEITTTSSASGTSPYPYGGGTRQAQGSGFVYDSAGHIVTNEHVVAGANSISVRFADGSTYKASLVGSDASTDIAVLKVDAPSSKLHPLALADSNHVQVGDGVVAIGSPFGLENSTTSGIVSAVHRQIVAPNDFTIDDAIQTDAAINHGNSGGPLLDLLGRVIGVTAQIKSDSGGNEGVGFAIPSSTVRSVASKLISSGVVEHAYLGVAVQTIPAAAATALGVPQGVGITEIRAGTPAAGAGLTGATGQKTVSGQVYPTGGDVITKVDGNQVTSADDLQSLIGAKSPGDQITITYVRAGSEKTVRVTLAKRPS